MAFRKKWTKRMCNRRVSRMLNTIKVERIAHIPEPVLLRRQRLCKDCQCGVNKDDACSACPKGRWKHFFCEDSFAPPPPSVFEEETPPTMSGMIESAARSAALWASRGFQHVSKETLKTRIETCGKCEFWNSKGFGGTGRCTKCGCSTWAKIRMATEKCPIGKW